MRRHTLSRATVIGTALVLAPLFAYAWTQAPANPPGSNVSPPLNQGGLSQAKAAGLLLNTGNNANGLIVQYGKVGIGTLAPGYKLQVGEAGDGSAVGSNAFFYMSDARLKKDVSTLSDALEKILGLRGVSFTLKSTGKKSVGLIAQEVEKVYPELVTTVPDGYKSVEYGNLVAPLIEAVKAQQRHIEALEARIRLLESKAK